MGHVNSISRGNWPAWLTIVLLAFISLTIFQHNVDRYPYYAMDDMDQLTALDVLLMRGGVLPDHITHPTAGMYVLLTLTHRVGYFLNLVHLRDFHGVETWANPLLGTAELIDFLRAHLPFLAVGSSMLLAMAVVCAAGASPWLIAPIFICIAASRALAFHTLIFRTDSFALFYAAAAAALAVSAVAKESRRTAAALSIGAGVLAGFAFTSKVQIIPTIALAPALVLFMLVRRDFAYVDAFNVSRRFNRHVSFAVVAIFFFLLALSLLPMPSTFIHTRTSFHNIALCGAALLAVASPGIATRLLPEESVFYRFFSFANLMALGFVTSFLLLWSVMISPWSGIRFVAAIAKVCFLGTIDPALSPGDHFFWDQVFSSPALLLPPLALLALLAFRSPRLATVRELGALLIISCLVIASLLWFSRAIMNLDSIFTEPLVLALCCIMLAMAWERGNGGIRALTAVFVVLFLARGAAQAEISGIADTGYAGYFRETRQILTPYQTGNQQQIEDAFRRLFVKDEVTGHNVSAHERELIFEQAANYRFITKQVSYLVPNLGRIDWSRIGVLGRDLKPFGQDRRDLWFTSVPPELEGATVYVPPDRTERPGASWLVLALRYCGLYEPESDAWSRRRTQMIRPRSDMNVLVFVPADQRQAFSLPETAPTVALADRRYVGVPVPINAPDDLLSRLRLEQDRFIVITRRYG